jgi:hypothetical protein
MMCTLQLSRWCRTLRQEALEMPCRKSRATWNNAGGVIKTRDFTRKSHGKTTLFLTNHSWEKRKTHIYHVFLIITVYFVRLELFTHKHIYILLYINIYIFLLTGKRGKYDLNILGTWATRIIQTGISTVGAWAQSITVTTRPPSWASAQTEA